MRIKWVGEYVACRCCCSCWCLSIYSYVRRSNCRGIRLIHVIIHTLKRCAAPLYYLIKIFSSYIHTSHYKRYNKRKRRNLNIILCFRRDALYEKIHVDHVANSDSIVRKFLPFLDHCQNSIQFNRGFFIIPFFDELNFDLQFTDLIMVESFWGILKL